MTGVARRPESLEVRESGALDSVLMLHHFAELWLSFIGRNNVMEGTKRDDGCCCGCTPPSAIQR